MVVWAAEALESKPISYDTRMRLYRTLIRTVMIHGSDTWTVSKVDGRLLLLFVRKIYKNIYSSSLKGRHEDREVIRSCTTSSKSQILYKLINKLGRLCWADVSSECRSTLRWVDGCLLYTSRMRNPIGSDA